MSNKRTFEQITDSQARKASIETLSDRPNKTSHFGEGGLSAQQLKQRFDALPELSRKKINEIIAAFNTVEGAKYIGINAAEQDNLYDFLALFKAAERNGKNIADYIEILHDPIVGGKETSTSIKDIINEVCSELISDKTVLAEINVRSNENRSDIEALSDTVNEVNNRVDEDFSKQEERITRIERYLGGENFVEDDTTAYEKKVPSNACEKAKIVSIGGLTYGRYSFISAKPTSINSVSPNMIPYPYDTMPTSKSGLIIIHNEDGSITFNGTTTEELLYLLGIIPAEKGETFTLAGCPKGGNTSVYRLYANAINADNVDIYADDLNDIGDGATHTVISDEINYYIFINIAKGKVCKNLTFKPMFYRGTSALPFAVNGIIDRFRIPEEVQNEVGYGLGIDESRCNFIIWYGSEVYLVRRVKETTVQTAEYVGWANESYKNTDFYSFKMPSDYVNYKLDAFIMEGFETTTSTNWDSSEFYGVATGRATEFEIWVGFPKGTPQDEAISAIEGKKIVYVLKEPEATNITELMPKVNLISVLGGGSIIAENEHNYPVPFGIKYLLKFTKEDA